MTSEWNREVHVAMEIDKNKRIVLNFYQKLFPNH